MGWWRVWKFSVLSDWKSTIAWLRWEKNCGRKKKKRRRYLRPTNWYSSKINHSSMMSGTTQKHTVDVTATPRRNHQCITISSLSSLSSLVNARIATFHFVDLRHLTNLVNAKVSTSMMLMMKKHIGGGWRDGKTSKWNYHLLILVRSVVG